MPRKDGTGPAGVGPMTGRGMGSCTNYSGIGYGMGRRLGRGCGRGNGPYAAAASPVTLAERKQLLKEELKRVDSLLGQSEKV
ncbi:DUF5320 domain-containing protein [Sphaerochaeta globosa]|uniref:Cytoplasmic protein n=1 Tax=Sphaerochaeta globosa (strain ATCC BAA-1886 / DSM 22777 / Buddy) TaxID=158189 RepID=F0RUQ4_SPHGB|nr:DUF5320 domain-containing protein [Sphaerochaeta globosa]ADY12482.1 hypothetical protein SpiBuddy_0655 [Sphaerochaeta globosa str. Buddy]